MQDLAVEWDMVTQLEGEVRHYRCEAIQGRAAFGRAVPLPLMSMSRHRSSSCRPPVEGSQATSLAPLGTSIRQQSQPPVTPSSAPEGEGESAP